MTRVMMMKFSGTFFLNEFMMNGSKQHIVIYVGVGAE